MKIAVARETYYAASATASTIFRQLALAGVAVIWLLAGGFQAGTVRLDVRLLIAALAVITALALDLFQYLWTTGCYARWAATREKDLDEHPVAAAAPPPLPAERVPTLARMLHYPPTPAPPGAPPVGSEREIGPSPAWILNGQWILFSAKMVAALTAYVLTAVELAHRIAVT